jgi:hypothetical protein
MYFKFEHLDIITERKKGKKCLNQFVTSTVYIYIYPTQKGEKKRIYRNLKRERERERERSRRGLLSTYIGN